MIYFENRKKKKKKSKLSVSATGGQLATGEKAERLEKGEKDTADYNDIRTPAQKKFDEVQAERVRRVFPVLLPYCICLPPVKAVLSACMRMCTRAHARLSAFSLSLPLPLPAISLKVCIGDDLLF